jgi:hypothetical protein
MIPKFETQTEMIAYVHSLTDADRIRIVAEHGIAPKNRSEASVLADYIVQGVSKGLAGAALTAYAEERTKRLIAIMPHLGRGEPDEEPIIVEVAPVAPAPAPAAPAAPAAATKAPRVAKTKYADGTIVARPDRGGFEGWYAGKAEAFRPTVEKVASFFAKKYPEIKTVVLA